MTTNQMNLTQLGLLNVNRKIIDSRKYKENSISTEGNVVIVNGTASSFDTESYLYKEGLSFTGSSEITLNFSGVYIPAENAQTVWVLKGTTTSVKLQVSPTEINVYLNGNSVLRTTTIPLTDNADIKIAVTLKSGSMSMMAYADDKVSQKSAILGDAIQLENLTKLYLGNDPLELSTFWKGSIKLQEFSIMENQSLLFTPSTNYSLTFTKILVSDGEFPLTNSSVPILDHVIEFNVTEVNRSGNTVLLTSQIDDESKILIKEIGLYAETEDGPILFSILSGLNIDKGKNVPYDLIFTVNIDISFVNAVGFPDTGSIVLEESTPVSFQDFNTVRDLALYVFTSLERIIVMNATFLGYNTPQVFYRLQQEIALEEESYSTVQTYAKLIQKLKRVMESQIDPLTMTMVGEVDLNEDGEATDFSTSDYLKADIYMDTNEPWEVKTSFSAEEPEAGSIVTLGSPSKNQSITTSIVNSSGNKYYNVKIEEQESLEATILSENITYYRNSNQNRTAPLPFYENPNGTVQINAENIATAFMGGYLYIPIPEFLINEDYEEILNFRTPPLKSTSERSYIQTSMGGSGVELELVATTSAMSIYVDVLKNGSFVDHEGLLQVNVQPFTEYFLRVKLHRVSTFVYSLSVELSADGETWNTPITTNITTTGTLSAGYVQFHGADGYTLNLNNVSMIIDEDDKIQTSGYLQAWTAEHDVEAYNLHLANPEVVSTAIVTPHTRTSDITWRHPSIQEDSWTFSMRATTGNINSGGMSANYEAVAYGADKFIAISGWGYLVQSPDGGTWYTSGEAVPEIKFTEGSGWTHIVYGNNKFVLLGTAGYISTSENGEDWATKTQPLGDSTNWKGIAYGNNTYVAISQNGYISTSSNGTTWTTPTQNSNLSTITNWDSAFIFNPITNLFTAISIHGYVSTSSDGTTWTTPAQNADSSKQWRSVTFDGAKLILVDYTGYLSYSATGTYWSTPVLNTDLTVNPYWNSATYGDGKIILGAVNNSNKLAILQLDSWQQPALASNLSSAIVGASGTTDGSYLVGIDADGNIKTSTSGSAWAQKVQLGHVASNATWTDIAAKTTTDWVASSTKNEVGVPGVLGETWDTSSRASDITDTASGSWQGLVYVPQHATSQNNSYFAAMGPYSGEHRDYTLYYITSTNGSTWTLSSIQMTNSRFDPPLIGLTYGNNTFILVDNNGNVFKSTNLTSWTYITRLQYMESLSNSRGRLVFGNNRFVCINTRFGTNYSYSYVSTDNGDTWTQYTGVQIAETIESLKTSQLTYDGSNFVFLLYIEVRNGQEYDEHVYLCQSSNGESWATTELSDSNFDIGIFEYNSTDQLGFTYNNGKYVLMSNNGNIMTTTNLTGRWTFSNSQREKLGDTNLWGMLTHGGNQFVALGQTGYTSKSTSNSYDILRPFTATQPHKVIYCPFLSKYVAVEKANGRTYTSTDGRTWTAGGTLSSGNNWSDLTCSDNKILVVGGNYLSTSTDGSTWTTPVQRVGSLITKTSDQFVIANSNGYVSYSRDGEHWTDWEQSSTLQPSANRYNWIASCYKGNDAYLFDNNGHFTKNGLPTASVSAPASVQYLLGKSTGADNNSPIVLTIENAMLSLKPTVSDLYAWRNSSTSTNLYTTTEVPSAGDILFNASGVVVSSVLKYSPSNNTMTAYYSGATRNYSRYTTGDTSVSEISLTSAQPLKANSTYDISISYDGSKYVMFYRLDPLNTGAYPDQETVLYYSKMPVSLNENSSIAFGSDNGNFKFMGTVDLSQCAFNSNGYNWVGATQLSSLLSNTVAPSHAYELFDQDTYSIPDEIPCTLHEGTILNQNLFLIEPSKVYDTAISYTGTSYKVSLIENSVSEIVLTEVESSDLTNPVTQIYMGAQPSYINNVENPEITSPFSGTLHLKGVSVTQENYLWTPVKEVITHVPQLIQYYHIPKLNRSQYTTKDFCDFEHTLTILEGTFTGNNDLINFSNPDGFTLSLKVDLVDSEPKILLAKTDSVSTPYLTLTFINNTLDFILYGINNNTYKFSKELALDEIGAFVGNPILLTIIYKPSNSNPTISIYRNNDKFLEGDAYLGTLIDPSAAPLTNYLPESTLQELCADKGTEEVPVDELIQRIQDNVNLYVSGLIAVSGAISEEELYYITNLTDTNF